MMAAWTLADIPSWVRCINCNHHDQYDQLDICELRMQGPGLIGAVIIDDAENWFCAAFEHDGSIK